MSASFASASTQYLNNSASPVTAYPWSAGMWVRPTQTAAAQAVHCISRTGSSGSHYWRLAWNTSSAFVWECIAGATPATATANGGTVNLWHYVVLRAISNTNRRISVLMPAGNAVHAQSTTKRTPSSVSNEALGAQVTSSGATIHFDGQIAEYWLANVDIQPDGAQLQDSLLRQLAYGGPFSVPDVRDSIVSYRSLRSSLGSDQNKPNEVWSPAPQTWVNTNGAALGPHPPLPYWRGSPKTAIRGAVPI